MPLAVAGWFTVTLVSQHPNRVFDRFRGGTLTAALVPNWRFFAPEPAVHDYRVLHRVLYDDGTPSDWQDTHEIAARTWRNCFWFPERRRDKALIDICNELLTHVQQLAPDALPGTVAYRLLRGFVERAVRSQEQTPVEGFQFLVVRDCGHDVEPDPEYLLVSRFETLGAAGPVGPASDVVTAQEARS